MRSKKQRQKQIVHIMESGHFHTQQEVAAALQSRGFPVSQSTLSKDFKELNMAKITAPDGSFKYVLPRQLSREFQTRSMRRELEDFVLEAARAAHIIVLKTPPGNASGVCETIDQTGWPEVVGTIAGENTILLVCKTAAAAKRLLAHIHQIMEGTKQPS